MIVYEYGEKCEFEGVYWSNLVIDSKYVFKAVKTSFIAKLELNISLAIDDLDSGFDDEGFLSAIVANKEYEQSRLRQVREAQTLDDLAKIKGLFVRQRNAHMAVGGDYWSLLAEREVEKCSQ